MVSYVNVWKVLGRGNNLIKILRLGYDSYIRRAGDWSSE